MLKRLRKPKNVINAMVEDYPSLNKVLSLINEILGAKQ